MAKESNKVKNQRLQREDFLNTHGISVFDRSVPFTSPELRDRWLRGNAQYNSNFVKKSNNNNNKTGQSEVIENSNKLFIPKDLYSHQSHPRGHYGSDILRP